MPVINSPVTPIPLFVFRRGVQAAFPVIDEGGKVLVHCLAGIHRSVVMACYILIANGYSSQKALELVKRQRAVAKPEDTHILARIKKFEADWNHRRQNTSTADIG
jgi:protein-tyrosine phosphatase